MELTNLHFFGTDIGGIETSDFRYEINYHQENSQHTKIGTDAPIETLFPNKLVKTILCS